MRDRQQENLDRLAQAIFDKKGFNILALDVRNFSTWADYYLIAEGNVDRHVVALSNAAIDTMKEQGAHPLRIDGASSGEWIVLDFGDIILHLLTPEMRLKYALEELWRPGKLVRLNIVVDKTRSYND